jgi:eukaryotic-like serine/threonine-protein kinase
MPERPSPEPCLNESEVVSFFAGDLTGERLARIEDHLDVCSQCALLLQAGGPLLADPAGTIRLGADPRQLPDLRFGDRYEVAGEIGRGGMGMVLDGRDLRIRRDLAIKVLLEGSAASGGAAARFVEEAQIQGQLEHPNICPVHDLGIDAQGRPFFTMKKVRGRSLERILEQQRGPGETEFSLRALLEIFAKVCDAVAFAHSRGVLHRDIKPANIMIGEFGEVLLMDWGLAKLIRPTGERETTAAPAPEHHGTPDPSAAAVARTRQGSVLGTPAFMPPEQAAGDLGAIDERSDVYALGGVLYAILTLRPPIERGTPAEILDRVGRNEIVAPTRAAPDRRIPADLAAAAMKAMRRTRQERYQSVADLRRDIIAFLELRTLQAGRYRLHQLARKWVQRNRVFAWTASAAVVLLLAGTIVYVARVTAERRRADRSVLELRHRLAEGLLLQGKALASGKDWLAARDRYDQAASAFAELGTTHAGPKLGALETYLEAPPALMVMTTLGPVEMLSVSPDGRLLASSAGGQIGVWEPLTGRRVWQWALENEVTSLTVSRDARRLFVGTSEGTLRTVDLSTGQELSVRLPLRPASWSEAPRAPRRSVVGFCDPDGRLALSIDDAQRVTAWEVASGKIVAEHPLDRDPPEFTRTPARRPHTLASLSPDGRYLITSSSFTFTVRELASGRVIGTRLRRAINDVAFSGDGRQTISSMMNGLLIVHDLPSGRDIATLSESSGAWPAVATAARAATTAAGGADGLVRIWQGERPVLVATHAGHTGAISALALSSDGRYTYSGSLDRTIRVWSTVPRWNAGLLRRERAPIGAIDLSRDGRLAAVADGFSRVALLDVATGRRLQWITRERAQTRSLTFSPDGRLLVWVNVSSERPQPHIRHTVWDLESNRELCSFPASRTSADVEFLPDGRRVLVPMGLGLGIWEARTCRLERNVGAPAVIRSLGLSPDGTRALSGDDDGRLTTWEIPAGKLLRRWPDGPRPRFVRFSDDGQLVATAGSNGIRVWDLGRVAGPPSLTAYNFRVEGLRLFPERWPGGPTPLPDGATAGRHLLTVGSEGRLRVWERTSAALSGSGPERDLHAFDTPAEPRALALSGDGRVALLSSGSGDLALFEFDLPERYRQMDARLLSARAALEQSNPEGRTLAELAAWYTFRGERALALPLLERARAGGAAVPAIELARGYWDRGALAQARDELMLARRQSGSRDDLYLLANLRAVEAEIAEGTEPITHEGPPGSKIGRLLVEDREAAPGWSIERNLQAGDRPHGDSRETLEGVPRELRGLDWIRTGMQSKSAPGGRLATMVLRRPAEVLVATDPDILPAWLDQRWSRTAVVLTSRSVDGFPLTRVIYKRRCPVGPVELGGMFAEVPGLRPPYGTVKAQMYLVAVR